MGCNRKVERHSIRDGQNDARHCVTAEKGASVTVLDREYGGGASAIAGGVVYEGR